LFGNAFGWIEGFAQLLPSRDLELCKNVSIGAAFTRFAYAVYAAGKPRKE